MNLRRFSMSASLNSTRFHVVLLCGIFITFLLILIARLTGIDAFELETAGRYGSLAPIVGFLSGLVPTLAIPASFLYIIFFILPGYLVARQLISRDIISKKYALMLSVVFSSLIAYFVFWVYFFNNIAGRVVSVIVIVSCIAFVIIRFDKCKSDFKDKDFIRPLTLLFLVGCMYLGILLLYHPAFNFAATSNIRFVHTLPGDNILMYFFVDTFYNGLPIADYNPDWLVSDRPPLFGAILLILRPLSVFHDDTIFYQFIGTFIQCLWIPALYSLCRFFSFDNKIRTFIIGSTVFSGVFIINSTYIWPKFATILYFALLLILVFELSNKNKITKNSKYVAVIIGICAAVGFLTHSGLAFSFIALGLAILVTEKRMIFIKHAGYAIIPFFIIYLPWVLFQRLVDPPANHLLKWHFAGMQVVNDYSFLEALYVSYSERPIGDIIDKTIVNIFNLFPQFPESFMSVQALRETVFFNLFGSATILNIFLIILVFYFIKRYCIEQKSMNYTQKIMFYFTVFSFTVWPLLMYLRNYTHIFLGSYANLLLVYLLIAFGAKHANKELRNVIYVLNIILFVALWVLKPDVSFFALPIMMSVRMFFVMIISSVLFLLYLHKTSDNVTAQ